MFLKIAILVGIVAAVWFGFRTFERRQNIADGKRQSGARTFAERLRKSVREKTGGDADPKTVEDLERCPKCGAFVPVASECRCS